MADDELAVAQVAHDMLCMTPIEPDLTGQGLLCHSMDAGSFGPNGAARPELHSEDRLTVGHIMLTGRQAIDSHDGNLAAFSHLVLARMSGLGVHGIYGGLFDLARSKSLDLGFLAGQSSALLCDESLIDGLSELRVLLANVVAQPLFLGVWTRSAR
jgi:hypothetical protein